MPLMVLTKSKVQILNPVDTGTPFFTFLEYEIVIGIHQARAIPKVYSAVKTVPTIIKAFATELNPEACVDC